MLAVKWHDPLSQGAEESTKISFDEFRGDAVTAARIITITAEVGWGKYYGSPEDYARTYLQEVAKGGPRRIYVAKLGPAVVAYAEVVGRPSESWAVGPGEVYLMSLAVLPRHARSGLGRALSERLFKLLAELGFARVLADVCWTNEASLRLTEVMGARLVGPSPKAVLENGGGAPHLRFARDL